MKSLGIVVAAAVLSVVAPGHTVKHPGAQKSGLSYSMSERNEQALLDRLLPVVRSSGHVARIYYTGPCVGGITGFVYFPALDVHKPRGSGLRAVQSIFRGESSM